MPQQTGNGVVIGNRAQFLPDQPGQTHPVEGLPTPAEMDATRFPRVQNPLPGAPRYPAPRTRAVRGPLGRMGPVEHIPAGPSERAVIEEAVDATIGKAIIASGITANELRQQRIREAEQQRGEFGDAGPPRGGPIQQGGALRDAVIDTVNATARAGQRIGEELAENAEALRDLAGKKGVNTAIELTGAAGSRLAARLPATTVVDQLIFGTIGSGEEERIAEIKAAEAAGRTVLGALQVTRQFVFQGNNVALQLIQRDP